LGDQAQSVPFFIRGRPQTPALSPIWGALEGADGPKSGEVREEPIAGEIGAESPTEPTADAKKIGGEKIHRPVSPKKKN
jgi:hypothetical protein